MRNFMKGVAAALTLFLAGCFEATGVHMLSPYGQSDAGGYSVWMSDYAWGEMTRTPDWPAMDSRNRGFSNPQTRRGNGGVFYEDMSGNAAMEHWYDDVDCREVGGNRAVCRFTLYVDAQGLTGWSLNWGVALEPSMYVVSSNHHRTASEGRNQLLIWDYDGDYERSVSIDFTVNVPVSRY